MAAVDFGWIYRRRLCTYFFILVLYLSLVECGRRSPLFSFTKSSYVATILENARGKVYANSDSKMGVYVPYWSSKASYDAASSAEHATSGSAPASNSVRYKIVSGDKQNFFKAESVLIGNFVFLRIRTKPSLDLSINRELTPEFSLRVKATLKRPNERNLETWTEVLLKVTDQNDLSPLFMPDFHSVEITDDRPLFSSVTQVIATDPDDGLNGEIYYYMSERNEHFAVNPITGVISLIKHFTSSPTVDRQHFTLKVFAEDRASRLFGDHKLSKASATVNITVKSANLNAPLQVVVNDDSNSSKLCGRSGANRCALVKVSDADVEKHGRIKNVEIFSGDAEHLFVINRIDNGLYEIRSVGVTPTGSYDLLIFAEDDGFPSKNSTLHLNVTVDEVCPETNLTKNELRFQIDECSPRGTVLGFVVSFDEVHLFSYNLKTISPFKLNDKNGLLTLDGSLDFETTAAYSLEISATSVKCGKREIRIDVTINDCNDNTPMIEDFSCAQILIERVTTLETALCTVKATDADVALNARISYSLHANDKNLTKLFWIDPINGVIKLRIPAEEQFWTEKEGKLQIRASDWGSPYRLESELQANVFFGRSESMKPSDQIEHVVLKPPNQFVPIFDAEVLSVISVAENTSVDKVVFAVRASDGDMGAAGFVRYAIVDGNADGYWTVDANSGYLKVLRKLDREKIAKFALTLEATDAGSPSKSVRKNVSIIILDVNDEKPTFERSLYSFSISESAKVGESVGTVRAFDADEGQNARISYEISPESPVFAIDPETGVLSIKQALDREIRAAYKLIVRANDHGSHVLSSTTVVEVSVDDVNDNVPECFLKHQKYQLVEDLPINSLITCIDAYDPDEGAGGRVSFRLSDGQSSGPSAKNKFAVESETGCIWLKGKLDYEERPVFNLSIELMDAGRPQLTTICNLFIEVVNVNENRFAPVFETFAIEASIYENEPEFTLVTEVKAKDADQSPTESVFSYSIAGGDGLGFFSIDTAGKIRTSRKLDRETKPFYWLTVVARDHGLIPLSSAIEVFINVLDRNDNSPIPSHAFFTGSIKENSPGNSVVLRVEAVDPDVDVDEEDDSLATSLLTYKINQGDPQSFFKIDSKTGYISTDRRHLDRESVQSFELEVAISDNGVPSLTSLVTVFINVSDENDSPPKFINRFNEFTAIANDSAKEMFLCRVFAVDADTEAIGPLHYNISEGNEDGRFWIDQKTGEIFSTIKLKPREAIALSVSVFDGKFSDETSVVVNVVDKTETADNKTPTILTLSNATIHISANEPLGRSVGLLEANDANDDSLWFYIEDGDFDKVFFLKPDTGELQIAKKPNLSVYHLTYMVTDGFLIARSKIAINVENLPDEKLSFEKESYQLNIFENETIGSVVFQLSQQLLGADTDVRYFLTSDFSDGISKFEVDPRTGNIYLNEHLDRETTKAYVLMVEARKRRQKTFTILRVDVADVNDHRPRFVSSFEEIHILETVVVDSVVAQLIAIDEDTGESGRLLYKIVAGNDKGFFAINPQNGQLTLAKPLLHENPEFVLSIKVEDGGIPSQSDSTTLRILLSTSVQSLVKFQKDLYTFRVSEHQQIGTVVGSVFVETGMGVTYSLEDSTKMFEINPTSGVISLNGKLDFETSRHLEMLIRAKGAAGGEDVARMVVKVVDSNDHAPIFVQKVYEGLVVENAAAGFRVLTKGKDEPLAVVAADVDTGPAGLVSYRILDSWAQNLFDVDYRTGAIRTKLSFDFEQTNLYEFSVIAEDMGEPKMRSLLPALIRIFVKDSNDNPPVFGKFEYVANVLLPTADGVLVATAKASDVDSTGLLIYSINNFKSLFLINKTSGELKIRNATSLQVDHQYDLSMSVTDGTFVATATMKVRTSYASTNEDFTFGSERYVVNVLENVSTRQTVLVLQTFGSALGEIVVYSFLNENEWFTLNAMTGLLETTGQPLDREKHLNGRIYLIVHAHDQRNPPRLARCVVEINIEDVNDCSPEFVSSPYSIILPAESVQSMSLANLRAVDADQGDNGRVSYRFGRLDNFLSEFVEKYLNLSSNDGTITLKRNFTKNFDEREIILPVIAFDHGTPQLITSTVVTMNIVNKDTPIFEAHTYNVSVSEGTASLGTVLMTAKAKSKSNNFLSYHIVDGDGDSVFWMDFITGELKVQKVLDRESCAFYRLTLRALDLFTNAASTTSVNIYVTDVNDNAPIFDKHVYTMSIKESVSVGTRVGKVQATDVDVNENAELLFSMASDNAFFEINKNTGDINLLALLDFETSTKYTLDIVVRDSGHPQLLSSAKVVVNVLDVNDNAPKFTQLAYESILTKNASMGSFVAQISAFDEDKIDGGRLIYSIFDGDDEQLFSVDPSSGVVKTSKSLENAVKSAFLLNLTASDSLFSASCVLSVKIQSKTTANVFAKKTFEINVKENADIGSLIGSIETTSASDSLSFRLLNGGFPFRIDSITGNLYTTEQLDAEKTKFYSIAVLAVDKWGADYAAQVKISVFDVNDNKPKFSSASYKIFVSPNVLPGSTVLQVFAEDKDENDIVEYSIRKDSHADLAEKYFKLDANNGKVEAKRDLKDLAGRLIRFFVLASDRGNPPFHDELPVEIEVASNANGMWMQFTDDEYVFRVAENANIGWKIGRVRIRAVSSALKASYVLLPNGGTSNNGLPFAVDANGTLTVVQRLNREQNSQFVFHVGVASSDDATKIHSLTLVRVKLDDVNDNAPKFFAPKLQLTIFEDAPIDSSVVVLSAFDDDVGQFGKVKYSIKAFADGDSFRIDPMSGWVLTNRKLDREIKESYSIIVVSADDAEVAKTSEIQLDIRLLDVNDVSPKFAQESYEFSIDENASPGTVIGQLKAIDNDLPPFNDLAFYIVEGNIEAFFGVHKNGQLYLSRSLDFERSQVHRLVVLVSDGQFSDTSLILINVKDADDTAPYCEEEFVSIKVLENAHVGSSIYSVIASDSDRIENSALTYSIKGTDDFSVNKEGTVAVEQNLDREKMPAYDFVVLTEDSGRRSCETRLRVTLTDVNDETPKFDRPIYSVDVKENLQGPFPQFLHQLKAIDFDTGNGSHVHFRFDDIVDNKKFLLDTSSGALMLLASLDREEISIYNLTIVVEDGGKPSLSATAHVVVNVLDVNDNPPEFLQKVYNISNIGEDTPIDVEITRVRAVSKDFGRNAEIRYQFAEPLQSEVFSLNENNGALTLKQSLDFEKTTEYCLTIIGVDGGEPPLSGSTRVVVTVLDVNDNSPVFSQEIYRTKILENETIGSAVLLVAAFDADAGSNGRISYEVIENRNNVDSPLFNISSDGRVMLASSLDYETKKNHVFGIKATDDGEPQRSAVAQLHVDLIDINDNPPVIVNCNRTIVLKQHATSGTDAHVFNTIDRDGVGNGAPFTYQLIGEGSDDFKITPVGHLQTAVSPLNQLQYSFKINVFDSGKPQLSSFCRLTVKITEDSRFPPEVSTFHTTLLTYLGEFHGGLVGKIVAHDRDSQDQLVYGIHYLSNENHEAFDVYQDDGRVFAAAGLKPGEYSFNVTAFDGSFLTAAFSKVDIKEISAEMLASSISIKLSDIDQQTFVQSKMHAFVRTTSNLLGVRPQFVHVISVQSDEHNIVEVLFAVRKSRQEFHKPTFVRTTMAGKLEEFSNLFRITELVTETCRQDSCVHGDCRDILTLDELNLVSILGDRINFVSPKHRRRAECICYEGYGGKACDKTINACGSKPCPSKQICIADDSISNGYHCSCPPGRHGVDCKELTCNQLPCPDSPVNFAGHSFVRFTVSDSLESEMDFSLQFRSTSPFGVLMFSSGKTDFQLLEIHGGVIQYRFDLGSGENIVRIPQPSVVDGRWHHIQLNRNGKSVTLSLDKKFSTKSEATGASHILNLQGAHFFLGAEVTSVYEATAPSIRSGFSGCLQMVELNGYRLPLSGSGVLLHAVRFECQLDSLIGVCRTSPCLNSGSCVAKGAAYVCACLSRFSGRHCELDTDPCLSSPCENGAVCENLFNDFVCKCALGFEGKSCSEKKSSTLSAPNITTGSWGVTWPELIGIVALLIILIILTILIVVLCRKRHKYRYKKANSNYIQNVSSDEIARDVLQPLSSCQGNSLGFESNSKNRSAPPLPPRLRSFTPHRGSKLSNLESALSTGIPTVQVRPLSMSERQSTPPPGALESLANYGSAAEELERLGRGPEADIGDNVDDWKAALQFVNFNDDSLERLKAVASSLGNSPNARHKRRLHHVDPLAAPSVTSIQCLPEDGQMSTYHWDYSDWNSTLGQPGGYNTLSRSEIMTDDEAGAATGGTLPRGVSKLEETDSESVGGEFNHEDDNELNELEEAAAGMDEFRQQLLALSRLNRRLDNVENSSPLKSSSKPGGSYLDKYLPRLQAPMSSSGSERRHLLDVNEDLAHGHIDYADDGPEEYHSEWSLSAVGQDEHMRTSMEGQLSSTTANSTNDVAAVCEIEDDACSETSPRRATSSNLNSSDDRISPVSVKKHTEV